MSYLPHEQPCELGTAARWPGIDPESTIRDDFDAKILAVLWAARKMFLPILWLGASIAITYFIIIREPSAFTERIGTLKSPEDLVKALLSPFTGVAVAIVMRIVVALFALGAAYPLTRTNGPDDYTGTNMVGRYWRMWWDRWQMSRAYRAERWSWSVRKEVLRRLDTWGATLHRLDLLTLWVNVLLFILFVALLLVLSAQIEP